jgi:hypothetical protein
VPFIDIYVLDFMNDYKMAEVPLKLYSANVGDKKYKKNLKILLEKRNTTWECW